MNKSALLIVISAALSSIGTYWVMQSGSQGSSEQFVKKSEFDTLLAERLNQNPDAVYAAVMKSVENQKLAEAERKREAILASQEELEQDTDTPFMGNDKADVNIVMFSDYHCGYCKKAAPLVKKLLEEDDQLKLVIKEYPVLGPASVIAAKASIAVYHMDKDKFSAFNTALFENPDMSPDNLASLSEQVGLDPEALMAEMAKPQYEQMLAKNHQLGTKLGINGTPAFIIDGILYPGYMQEDQLKAVIEQLRAKRVQKAGA